MHISTRQRGQNFSIWLRTGRWPSRDDSCEFKFNPWHDPDDGRFTFTGAGRRFGPAGSNPSAPRRAPKIVYVDDPTKPAISSLEEADAWRAEQLAKRGHKPGYPEAIEERYQLYRNKFVRPPIVPPSNVRRIERRPKPVQQAPRENVRSQSGSGFGGGGGDFGGGGASGSWGDSSTSQGNAPTVLSPKPNFNDGAGQPASGAMARSTGAASDRYTITRNGYAYELDARGRTRRVSGTLSLADTTARSRNNQARAGGADRRASDDGGHYIAGRFNGPTDAFNHFAQDKNFNRGRYRVLEDQWARAKRAGNEVKVAIVPHYHNGSKRPFEIDVRFKVDGREHSIKMPNERTEEYRGK